jgi:hypothetical protein
MLVVLLRLLTILALSLFAVTCTAAAGLPCIDTSGPNSAYTLPPQQQQQQQQQEHSYSAYDDSYSTSPTTSTGSYEQERPVPRPLSERDFAFLKSQIQLEREGEPTAFNTAATAAAAPATAVEVVTAAAFKQFCEALWLPTVRTLGSLRCEWRCCDPAPLLHGFLSRYMRSFKNCVSIILLYRHSNLHAMLP